MMKENWVYRRGDIYMANLNPFKGSEQGGTRPVLVLQNNTGNLFCPTLIVAPLTTQVNKKKDQPTHYLLDTLSAFRSPRTSGRFGCTIGTDQDH